jgi:hypothetical protein
MRQVREVLRLTTAGIALNEIARRVGVAPSTVRLTPHRQPALRPQQCVETGKQPLRCAGAR